MAYNPHDPWGSENRYFGFFQSSMRAPVRLEPGTFRWCNIALAFVVAYTVFLAWIL
jgi:hypothetical protein